MHEIHQRAKRPRSPESDNEGIVTGHQGSLASYLDNSFQMVRSSSAAFLVSSSPIQSTLTPPTFVPVPISPYSHKKARYSDLLVVPPSNVLEEELQNSVRELLAANKEQKSLLISMQSSLVLNGAYCDLVRGQLAAQEESKKSKKKGKLVGDGMPRLLTSKDFVRRVVAFQNAAEQKEAEMKKRRATKAEKSTAMSQWKELEKARKAENTAIRARWQEDVKAWEEERDRAKANGQRPSWNKPVLKGQLFSPVPKPTFVTNEQDEPIAGPSRLPANTDSDESESEDSEDENDSADDE
ncbi:hypothetical protein DFH08DRAFT_708398 [Mycena albidolilacea]|uniref:Uncharacterized protein n=1 Tax=Mycena albidolilacea TaxID=1033008 RepID=A0AAD6ZNR9_9AGAR|nr:hypothetical protein DFH08DRAFT_708398 [Mycena albidolilacea]